MPTIFKHIFLAITPGTRQTCNREKASKKNTVAHYLSGRLTNLQYILDVPKCFIGELGLTGEVRRVNRIEQRVAEAAKLGFKRVFIPK